MRTKAFSIVAVIALALYIFTLTRPNDPLFQIIGAIPLQAALLYGLYRFFYVEGGKSRGRLIVVLICLVLEVASNIFSMMQLMG